MNCEIHQLSPLRCEAFQAKEVLRAVLHTVIFGRALGVVRPRDVDCELFDLTYVTCGDAEAERAVDEKLDALVAWLRKQDLRPGGPDVCAQVALSFYERRDKGARWFGGREERPCWEQWRIPLEVFAGDDQAAKEREQRSLELQDVLRGAVQHALGLVNEKRDHIPPVVSADVVSFPFDIGLPGDTESAFGTLKRMMMHASPPNMIT